MSSGELRLAARASLVADLRELLSQGLDPRPRLLEEFQRRRDEYGFLSKVMQVIAGEGGPMPA